MALLSAKRAKKMPPTDKQTDSSDDHQSNDASDNEGGNSGWANSMLKVLQTTKPTTQNKTMLSRAKKLNSTSSKSKQKDYDFEITGSDVKKPKEEQEQEEEKDVKPEAGSALDAQLTRQQRKNVPLQLRVKPSYRDMERERNLRKVATRGTVQFFNAVRIQQKDLQKQLNDAGPLDSRQDAVLNNIDKRKFLDVLMSGKRAKSSAIDNRVKKEESETDSDSDEDDEDGPSDDEQPAHAANKKKKSEWNVLREDFMTNKKIKHWDEEDEDEEQAQQQEEQQQGSSEDSDDD
ncbi:RRP15-like protein [Drosophila grimshawi]|uniref:RRP15-like protein n=1 Tax=Drosophila grimshawi TaxID=7222 RepID=B4JH01_DROGR|nr:RRP15-like protein [Drosophila grimshawi]EDV93779.1 GH18106 [Drosophila grimshawi]